VLLYTHKELDKQTERKQTTMCFNSNELPTVTNEDGAEMTPIAGPVLDYQSVMVDDGTGSSVTALFKLGVQLAEIVALLGH